MDAIIRRILRQIGSGDILEQLSALPRSDLHTLQLAMFKKESETITMGSLMRSQASNRFVAASSISPIAYHCLEVEMLEMAEASGITPVMLSPVAPLGSCSAFGCVDQNKVISATRGVEVLADASNVLALLLAKVRCNSDSKSPVTHLCATARVIRGQASSGKRHLPHFGLFTIVSGGKDSGDFACEAALIQKHFAYYRQFAINLLGHPLHVVLSPRSGYPQAFVERMAQMCRQALPAAKVAIGQGDHDNSYYQGLNFKLYLALEEERVELGDGGFVDWTARLMNNRKERCLISGVGIDRLMALRASKGSI